jgi:hypothetical protein
MKQKFKTFHRAISTLIARFSWLISRLYNNIAEGPYAMNNSRILSSEYGCFRKEIQSRFKERILTKPSTILDPMAGTAPLIPFVEKNGHKAYFNDILPIHFFINKAKTYRVFKNYQSHGHDWFFSKLVDRLSSLEGKMLCISNKWIDDSVLDGLKKAWNTAGKYSEDSETLFKAVIILCVRPLSSTTRSKNPTWLKYGGMSSGKDIREIIAESLSRFENYYHNNYQTPPALKGECIITNQSASELKLPQKVDTIITSPPYCNRLDPFVLYGPENYFLSTLGFTIQSENLVSTTIVRDYKTFENDFELLAERSTYTRQLLTRIKKSPIRDDPGYYLKYYTRYFARLFLVIDKALANLSSSGKAYIVTQDNNHRGERIDIDKVLRQLLQANGWHSKVIKTWPRHHQGLRNVSRNHTFVRRKMLEKLTVFWK